jgi:hypothetical protein
MFFKSDEQKKQEELQEMALHHLLTYPEKWKISDSYRFKQWINKELNFRIELTWDRYKQLDGANFEVEGMRFTLCKKVKNRILTEEKNKQKVEDYNNQQKKSLLRQNTIHKAKDRLWKQLQDRADGKEPEKPKEEPKPTKTFDILDKNTGRIISYEEYEKILDRYHNPSTKTLDPTVRYRDSTLMQHHNFKNGKYYDPYGVIKPEYKYLEDEKNRRSNNESLLERVEGMS